MVLIDTSGRTSAAVQSVVVTTRLAIRPRATTVRAASGHVLSAVKPPGLTSSVLILVRGSTVPSVGSSLVVEPGGVLPEGFLGRVSGASRNTDGTVTVTAQPTALDAAYSQFSVAISQNVRADNVFLASTSSITGHAPVAHPANISAIPFTCVTQSGWSVSATADFSHTHVQATLDIGSRAIHFLLTTDPTFTLGATFQGSATCTLANANELHVVVPIAAPLTLTIRPEFEFNVSGSFHAQATWAPRLAIGFDRAPGISQNPVGFGSSLSFDANGQADADLYAGLSVELGIGGRVGVAGTVGPHLHAAVTTTTNNAQSTACASVTAWAHAELTANADIFIRHWSWTLYSGDFGKSTIYNHCVSTATGGPGGGTTGTGTGSGTSSGGGTGSTGPGSGSESGSGSAPPPTTPPPPPPTTDSETTGGVAHTWTNYSNAGGIQGPSIPSNDTVQIACKLTGFKVADGNTWWYRIASAPWNGGYYVSADAFYNNGQTSGSLVGTPFVDPNVPNC